MFGFFVPFWAPVIIKKQDDPLTSLRTTTDIQRASLKTLYQKKTKKKNNSSIRIVVCTNHFIEKDFDC